MWPDTRRETRRLNVSRRFQAWTRQPLQTYAAAALLCALLPTALRAQTNAITVAYHQGQAPVAPDAIATLGTKAKSVSLLQAGGGKIRMFDGDEGIDPHAWLDPTNADVWLGTIATELAHLGTANSGLTYCYASDVNDAGTAIGYGQRRQGWMPC